MNEKMIENWNSVVKPGDDVYELGDFAFATEDQILNILNRLNGNIHHIFGNHDKQIKKSQKIRDKFVWCRDYYELNVDGQMICMMHYPLGEWNKCHRGAWHLHGHTHGNYTAPKPCKIMDVGVPCINYTPIAFEEIKIFMDNQPLLEYH